MFDISEVAVLYELQSVIGAIADDAADFSEAKQKVGLKVLEYTKVTWRDEFDLLIYYFRYRVIGFFYS